MISGSRPLYQPGQNSPNLLKQAQNVVALRQQCRLKDVFTMSGGIVKKPSATNKVVNGQLQRLLLKLQPFKSWHVNSSRRCFLATCLIRCPFGVSQQMHEKGIHLQHPASSSFPHVNKVWCGWRRQRGDGGERCYDDDWRGGVRGSTAGFGLLAETAGERATAGPADRKAPASPRKDAARARDDGPEKGFSALVRQLRRPQRNRQFSSFNTGPSSMICDAVGE